MTEKTTVACPCCESKVSPDRIDATALTPEARNSLSRDQRKKKFADTRAVVDKMRAEKVARREGREIA